MRDFAKIQQARKNSGLPISDISYHLVSAIANGRGARNLCEKVVTQQAKRTVAMSESQADELSTITEDDIKNALVRGDR